MPPETVSNVRAWLQSRWQVCVPEGWLEACVEWLEQEAGGRPLTPAQLQQQALEQWLQTDLRSLDTPSLPAAVCEAVKTELQGNICVQLDSLQDVSQPAYTQLQRLRGSERANDQVGAVTQATQRPWEATPTRMLMLQLTDGVRSVEGMEYKPIPQLNPTLPPGTKLLLRGPITCRLGVLLLQAQNVQVLGGEVEELVQPNRQESVLCRSLGLPEPEAPGAETEEDAGYQGDVAPPPAGVEDELDDLELMASLEDLQPESSLDSGYRSASASLLSTAPHRPPQGVSAEDRGSWRGRGSPQVVPAEEEVFMDEDDDIPLEELDQVLSQHALQPEPLSQERAYGGHEAAVVVSPQTIGPRSASATSIVHTISSEGVLKPSEGNSGLRSTAYTPSPETVAKRPTEQRSLKEPAVSNSPQVAPKSTSHAWSPDATPHPFEHAPHRAGGNPGDRASNSEWLPATVAWDSPPFSYLRNLQRDVPRAQRVHAFVVTLNGTMRSAGGRWSLDVCISDGSAYVDVQLDNALLAKLIGVPAAQSRALKRSPEGAAQVQAGYQRCQRALVDMCGVMTLQTGPQHIRPLVVDVQVITQADCDALQRRMEARRARSC